MNMSEEMGSSPCSPCPVQSWLGETSRRAAWWTRYFPELTCSPPACESTGGPGRQERSQRGLRHGCCPRLHPEPGVEEAGVLLGQGWSFDLKKLRPQAHADGPECRQCPVPALSHRGCQQPELAELRNLKGSQGPDPLQHHGHRAPDHSILVCVHYRPLKQLRSYRSIPAGGSLS